MRGVHLSLTHDACGCVAVCSFRLLPHLQNTGGFFVATFRKLGPMNHSSALKRAVQLQRLGEAVLVASARQKREQKAAKAAARRKPQSQGGRAFASFLEVPATIKERIVDTYGLTYVPMIARGFVCTLCGGGGHLMWPCCPQRRFSVAKPVCSVREDEDAVAHQR